MKNTNVKLFYIWFISILMAMIIIFIGVNVGAFKAFAASNLMPTIL